MYSHNDVLFIALNTNILNVDYHKNFISSVIDNYGSKFKWTIITTHKSMYSATYHSEESDVINFRNSFSEFFSRVGIDVVLSGHDHCYTRSYMMNGTTPIITDTVENSVTNPGSVVLYITENTCTSIKYYTPLEIKPSYGVRRNAISYDVVNLKTRLLIRLLAPLILLVH